MKMIFVRWDVRASGVKRINTDGSEVVGAAHDQRRRIYLGCQSEWLWKTLRTEDYRLTSREQKGVKNGQPYGKNRRFR